jgi:hypothetical protein
MSIDIRFVIIPQIKNVRDPAYKEAIELRDAFVNSIISRNPLLKKGHTKRPYSVNPDGPISIITDDGSGVVNAVYNIDIYCNLNQPFFSHYQNFFNEKGLTRTVLLKPIPYITQGQIRYATCGWIYFDAVRQMVSSKEGYAKFPDSPTALAAYGASVARFARLYIHMNTNRIDDNSLTTLYDQVRKVTIDEAGYNSPSSTLAGALAALKKKTNMEKVERQLVAPPAYAECTKKVINYLMETILGKYMRKYSTDDYYPVVIGGASLTRCLDEVFNAQGKRDINIAIKDIDMPMSVRTADTDLSKIVNIRNAYLADIIADSKLIAFLAKLGAKHNLVMTFQVDVLPSTAPEQLWKFRLAIVSLRFHNNAGRFLHGVNIIDCPIYTQANRAWEKKWRVYDKLVKVDFHDPIPSIINSKNVILATCGYVKYDTVQMLLVCREELEKHTKMQLQQQQQTPNKYMLAWYYKYIKYLAKYAALNKKMRAFKLARTLLTTNELLEMPQPSQAKLDEILASLGTGFQGTLDKARRARDAS